MSDRSNLECFAHYAAAFEEAYASRDFAPLAPYFTEDAEYEIHAPGLPNQCHRGREAVLAYLAWITEHFDRRFAERRLMRVAGPVEGDQQVTVHGVPVYTLEDGERCHLPMSETAHFRGDRIARLVDTLSPGAVCEMRWIVERHPDRFPADVLGSAA